MWAVIIVTNAATGQWQKQEVPGDVECSGKTKSGGYGSVGVWQTGHDGHPRDGFEGDVCGESAKGI